MKKALPMLILAGLAASCGPRDAGEPSTQAGRNFRGFPVRPPITDADPAVRESRAFKVPSRLNVQRTETTIAVSVDMASLRSISLDVGRNMVTGFKHERTVFRGDQIVLSGGHGLGGSADIGTSIINTGLDGIPMPGETYRIEQKFSIFETDIPAQHRWSPSGPRYKVIWSQSISAVSK
ncbi:MAG: hypothetical protein OER86_10960 [Phycisphaerae bacterium]|nr:hypothetical protein [Phycisphaerae bacterium]